jgi:hypothetical protein
MLWVTKQTNRVIVIAKKIKKHAQCFVFATIFVCVIANTNGIFYDCKKT